MKTRILSFILALVMVLSCMSMSILATDTPDAQAASEGFVPEATEIPCKDAASIIGRDLAFAADFDTITADSVSSMLSGNFWTVTDENNNVYITMKGSTTIANFQQRANASYVISCDIMINPAQTGGTVYAFDTIASTNSTQGLWPILFDVAGGNVMYQKFVEVKSDGKCDRRNTNTGVTFEKGKFYRVDLVHHVVENTYDFYFDGELVIAGETATNSSDFTLKSIKLDPNKDYMNYDNIKVYYSDYNLECGHKVTDEVCEWCGKSFKTNVGSHTHTPVALPEGNSFSCSEAKALLGDKLVYEADFDTRDASSEIKGYWGPTADESGNKYLKTTKTGELSIKPEFLNFSETKGDSYVVSLDFMLPSNYTGDYYVLYTIGSDAGKGGIWPFAVNNSTVGAKTGILKYNQFYLNSNTGAVTRGALVATGVAVELDVFHRFDFVHNTKSNTFDLYMDGELVLDDMYAYFSGYTFNMTSVQLGKDAGPCYDNIKIYYSDEMLECQHGFSDSFTCDWCGETFDVEFEDCDICNGSVISEGAAVVEKSVSLGEMIDMNVYMSLSDELINSDSKVVLTCGNRTAEYALADAVAEENGLYKFAIELRSTQMASDVEVKVIGEVSNIYKTSIKAYAEELIETSENASAVKLAKALLNYGAAAQEYFAEWNGDDTLDDLLANAGLSDADKTVVDVTGKAGFNALNYAPYVKGGDVEFTDATIMFSAQTHVKIFFTASEEATVTVGGKEVIPNAGDGRGEYYVTFTVESPKELMTPVSIVVTDGDSMVAQEFSAGLLIKIGVAAELRDSFTALLKAYAYYGMCSSEYVA